MYDVMIIGGGVIGCSIARQLSKYRLRIALVESENDISMGASKANSAIVHGGYAEAYTTLRGRLCYQGRNAFSQLNKELDFGFQPIGSLVVATDDSQRETLEKMYENGIKNGLSDLKILSRQQVLEIEPNVTPQVRFALYCEGAGICSPYELTIALAENAVRNGTDLYLNSKVTRIQKYSDSFLVGTEKGEQVRTRYLINAAGMGADNIAKLAGISHDATYPRSGQYLLMRPGSGELINHVLFQMPSDKGKGILVTPTIYGNLLVGPDAIDEISDNRSTSRQRLYQIYRQAKENVPDLDIQQFLRSFAGVRAVGESGDFVIEQSREHPHFIHLSGIQSPGLTSSPAIAHRVTGLLADAGLELDRNPHFDPTRQSPYQGSRDIAGQEIAQQVALPLGDPDRLVCRCERVSEREMRGVLARPIPIHSVDAMKRRLRSGMGLCQGQFCRPRTQEVIESVTQREVSVLTDIEQRNISRVSRQEMLAYVVQQEKEQE